jgi:hypothetical protein
MQATTPQELVLLEEIRQLRARISELEHEKQIGAEIHLPRIDADPFSKPPTARKRKPSPGGIPARLTCY